MSSSFQVRKAELLDIPILIEYNLAHANEIEGYRLNREVLKLGVENALKRNECHYFVAEYGSKVIGQTMITYEWSDWRNGIMWWLQSVYVNPNFRNRGVFRSIFSHIEKLAKSEPYVKALRLYVKGNNLIGMNTYQNLGMKDSKYIVYEKEFIC